MWRLTIEVDEDTWARLVARAVEERRDLRDQAAVELERALIDSRSRGMFPVVAVPA